MAEEKKAPPIGQKRVFEMEDLWALNEKFTSKLKRFVVKEARFPTDVKEDTAGVDAERKYAIESCIVRVMKSRKVYGHQDLINDVMKLLLKFSPDAKDVRSGIEGLIKKEYLERDPEDMNTLRYQA